MIQSQETTLAHRLPENGEGQSRSFEFMFPLRAGSHFSNWNRPKGLVTSSDEAVQQQLAQIMSQCGLATFLAFTASESRRIVDLHEVCLVVCDDRLIDGNYEDILRATEGSPAKTPVIVVSRTGDWPEYLKAATAGAFDYLAYPPIPGELPRAIRNALASEAENPLQETAIEISNSPRGEMP